jgi:dienelactone hydrolase
MLTILEILMILPIIPVLAWPLLPVKRVPRFLDFLSSASVVFLVLHLFIDNEPVRFRFLSLYIFIIAVFLFTIVRIFRHNPDQPRRRVLAGIGRVFTLGMLAFSIMMPTVILPFHSLPQPTGIYDVGTVTISLVDENRMETFAQDEGKHREIAVQFWYPADRAGSEPQYDISGAPVSDQQQNYPVVIFSHGAFGVRMSNASLCRELASHGYIAASIDHTYHSFYTSFPDGRTVLFNPDFLNNALRLSNEEVPAEEQFQITGEWMDTRTADIELVIDSLKSDSLGADGEFLNGRMDLDNIGLAGHSLGGAASAQVARERDEVKAAIVIDGTMLGEITGIGSDGTETLSEESFPKPLMLMYNDTYLGAEGKESSYRPNINAYDHAAEDAYSICIKDSGHINFTDLPRISPFLSGMLGTGTVDSYDCIKAVNDYSLAFFEQYLNGKTSPLLDGTAADQRIVFEKRLQDTESAVK